MLIFDFVFVKQNTAYELRISDCSSDVCSSVLVPPSRALATNTATSGRSAASASTIGWPGDSATKLAPKMVSGRVVNTSTSQAVLPGGEVGRASCRARGCQYV